jgi:antitoxin (DNA-binding transcriptional repressor) of toxin-antitoxin stability system
MKVKVGELKTHLSKYLHDLQAGGDTIEVCVREKVVAYLSPITSQKSDSQQEDVRRALAQSGLKVSYSGLSKTKPKLKPPVVASDGRTDLDTVEMMRAQKNY